MAPTDETTPGRVDALLVSLQAGVGLGLLLAFMTAAPTGTPTLRRILAALLGPASLALGAAALAAMRHQLRIRPTPRADATLLENGIYRRLRHPMYTAVVGLALTLASLRPTGPVLALTAANLVLYLVKARYEEGRLCRRFPGYEDYRRRTWGVVPGLR